MTDLEQKYFEMVYGEEKVISYKEIATIQNISEKAAKQKYKNRLDNYYAECLCNNNCDELNQLRNKFASYQKLRKYYKDDRKEMFKKPFELVSWYEKQNECCCYCGVKEKDLNKYFNENNPQYFISKDEKARQRGKFLEIERVVTAPKSKNVYTLDNTRLACYICNNAKSDFLSAKDFEPIAIGIYNFWNNREGITEIVFPIDFYQGLNK